MRFVEPAMLPVRSFVPFPDPADRIVMPDITARTEAFEQSVYEHFTHYMRRVRHSRVEVKVLAAIRYAADSLQHGDALTAKILVDLGLRAPREAFPEAFLDFIDRSLARRGLVPASSVMHLINGWTQAD